MLKEEIAVGKAYVNEGACIIREVIEEVDSRHVKYMVFELDTGRLLPARHQVCGKRELRNWADREARPQEVARMHPFDPAERSMDPFSSMQARLHPDEARAIADAVLDTHMFPTFK